MHTPTPPDPQFYSPARTHARTVDRACNADYDKLIQRINGHHSFSRVSGVINITPDGIQSVEFDPSRWAAYLDTLRGETL